VNPHKKIVQLNSLKRILPRLRKQGKIIAFTNGCFDILHAGHIRYLEAAKKKNRILVIGLNSDSSVRKIKGKGRPIVDQKNRARVLAALDLVNYIVIFNEKTPFETIKAVKPDILIKGADWKDKGVVGSDIVKSCGGKVELAKYIKGYSTTKIIQSIYKTCKKKKTKK